MRFIYWIIATGLVLLSSPSLAENTDIAFVRWLSLKKFSLEVNKIQEYQDPYASVYLSPSDKSDTDAERWDNRIAATFEADIFRVGKFGFFSKSNYWVINTDRQTPRMVGVDGKIGASWADTFDVFYQQRSERLLNDIDPESKFPRHSWFGASITFYERNK